MVTFSLVTPDDIRALRVRLRCTMQELAATLQVPPRTVIEWEDAELFPTKTSIERMRALDESGPVAVLRKGRRRLSATSPMAALAEPEVWRLFRKLLAHPELRQRVSELAADYAEPE